LQLQKTRLLGESSASIAKEVVDDQHSTVAPKRNPVHASRLTEMQKKIASAGTIQRTKDGVLSTRDHHTLEPGEVFFGVKYLWYELPHEKMIQNHTFDTGFYTIPVKTDDTIDYPTVARYTKMSTLSQNVW
jgi:hypothetical protein